jgi:hypothetical protein
MCNVELDFRSATRRSTRSRRSVVARAPLQKESATRAGCSGRAIWRTLRRRLWRYGTTTSPGNPRRSTKRCRSSPAKTSAPTSYRPGLLPTSARENGIPVGARGLGRRDDGGLSAGDVQRPDPMKFVSASSSGSWTPARNEMPDIDIDICQGRAREDHRVCPQQVRPRRADHHLRHAGGEGGVQGRRPGARRAAGGDR